MVESTEQVTDKLRDEIDKELQTKILALQKESKKLKNMSKDVKQELSVDLILKLCTRNTNINADYLQEIRSDVESNFDAQSNADMQSEHSEQSKSTAVTNMTKDQ